MRKKRKGERRRGRRRGKRRGKKGERRRKKEKGGEMGRGDEKWEMRRHKKTDSLERPSALDNKNLNSFYRIIEIILIIANPIIAKF